MVTRKSNRGTHHGANKNYSKSNDKYDILLQLLRMISKEPILMILLCIWMVIAILGIIILSERLQNVATQQSNGVVILPDLRCLGYTHEQLYSDFYYRIGSPGCSIYSTLALWDIVILVPAYVLLLGTLYVHVTRYTYDKVITSTSMSTWNNNDTFYQYDRGYWNADRRVTYLLLPIAILDWIETFIQRRGCTLLMLKEEQQREELSNIQVRIASFAVSLKWSLLGLFFLSIMERLYRVYCNMKQPSNNQRLLPLWI
jgi:hypothetical protein